MVQIYRPWFHHALCNDDAPEIRARVAAELADAQAQVSLHTVDGVEHMGDGTGVK